jgi:hypothetical protein
MKQSLVDQTFSITLLLMIRKGVEANQDQNRQETAEEHTRN